MRRLCPPELHRALLALLAAAAPAGAEIATDDSFGPPLELVGPEYQIPASLGRQRGGNLFHSFSVFDLVKGERATFSDTGAVAPIDRVLSRVTGGAPSQIDGVLRSTIAGADLYLLNPAGVIFGPNARLDLRGSFHASTADALEFPNGERFEARAGGEVPLLAVSRPEAFGFLHEAPAPIEIDRSQLAVREGESLSLVGGDLSVHGRRFVGSGVREIVAPSGRLDLVSVGSAGRVVLPESPDAPPVLEGVGARGDVTFDGGWASTRGASGAGRVFLRGGEIVLDRAAVDSDSRSAGDAGSVDVDADSLRVVDGLVGAFATNLSTGRSGTVAIRAREVSVASVNADSRIDVRSFSAKAAGSIDLDAERVEIIGGGSFAAGLDAAAFGAGDAGRVTVRADEVKLQGNALLGAASFHAAASAGSLEVEARTVDLVGRPGTQSAIFDASSHGTGAGEIRVSALRLALTDARLDANEFGSGGGGTIDVAAGEVALTHATLDAATFSNAPAGLARIEADRVTLRENSGVFANSVGSGDAGVVEITAAELDAIGSSVSARSWVGGPAAGGTVRIDASRVSLVDSRMEVHSLGSSPGGTIEIAGEEVALRRSVLDAPTLGSGPGGSVRIEGDRVSLRESSGVFASSGGRGNAGSVEIDAGDLEILRSKVDASGFQQGNAGEVSLTGARIRIAEGGEVRARTRVGTGDAGTVRIAAASSVEISGNDTDVDASAAFGGRVGSVAISGPDVLVDDHAQVSASAFVPGEPGSIRIDGERIAIRKSGIVSTSSVTGPAGTVQVEASESVIVSNAGGDPLSLARLKSEGVPGPAGIYASNVSGEGESGSVAVAAPLVRIEDGGIVATSTLDRADAGEVAIRADRVEVLRGGLVDSSSTGAGDAGTVSIEASGSILVAGAGADGVPSRVRSFAAGGGDAGDIALAAPLVTLAGGAVATTTVGEASTGNGGAIWIHAAQLRIAEGGRVDSGSFGAGAGGQISLEASEALEVTGTGSGVFAETGGTGIGGALRISGGSVRIADGGTLSSRAGSGVAGVAPVFQDAVAGGFIPEPRALPDGTPGLAGDISVDAARIELAGATIDAEAASGAGGNVELRSTGPLVLEDSSVTASVGDGSGGNVMIDPPLVVLDASRIVATAGSGEGGRVEIHTDLLLVSTDSEISADAGVGVDGSVALDAPEVDLAASLAPLPEAPLAASGLLHERCAGVRSDAVGSFVVRGREAAPAADPEGLLLALVPPLAKRASAAAAAPAPTLAGALALGRSRCPTASY